jgi:hypothetical protein
MCIVLLYRKSTQLHPERAKPQRGTTWALHHKVLIGWQKCEDRQDSERKKGRKAACTGSQPPPQRGPNFGFLDVILIV